MRAYKFRMYPNNVQETLINKTLGSTRFVYNYYLAKKKDRYAKDKAKISCYECIKDLSQNLSKEKDWLKEVDNPQRIIGLDLGLKDLVITSNGDKYKNEKVIDKYELRIKQARRRLSKKVPKSNNCYKMKQKLAVLYKKLQNARKNIIHNITNKIVEENAIIVTEILDIKNMTKNHHLSKSIIDATWYELIRQIGYKSKWQGKKFYQIDTFYPSSQICSKCGYKNSEVKKLSVREWKCLKCGNDFDRDINASINIMFEGLKKYMQEAFA
ncbi:MAG: RNA-guided endonuclease TnpB family protein [Bacilli bacterium]|jgi:putative transposase